MQDKSARLIFKKNLADIMYRKRITQTDIIRDLGYTQATVSGWCRGEYYPRPQKMFALAEYLGVPVTVLTGDSDQPVENITLSAEEVLLVKKFRCLNDSQKSLVRNMLGMFVEE